MVPSRLYPALEITWPSPPEDETVECLLAAVDGASPSAAEPLPTGIRIFFATPDERERAAADARAFDTSVTLTPIEVSDESWAERSQASLSPVTVGCLTIAPPWSPRSGAAGSSHWITIQPSMGFGTGHHQTTRLCLALLQTLAVTGSSVVDIGTGSGVLALAACRLGAATVIALDVDPDALEAARENVERNGLAGRITLRLTTLTPESQWLGDRYDLALANLTGATLERLAGVLSSSVHPGGALVVSGLQRFERDGVVAAFAANGATVERDAGEDEWMALVLRRV